MMTGFKNKSCIVLDLNKLRFKEKRYSSETARIRSQLSSLRGIAHSVQHLGWDLLFYFIFLFL